MKRPKEEAQQTKEQILEIAYDCFYEKGYMGTSLEDIAKKANMTRGAIYWHFKDKEQLYREVVENSLEMADVVLYAYTLDKEMSFKERLYKVFWFAQDSSNKVEFIYKTLISISQNDKFSDLLEKIKYEKIKLFRYFTEEIRIYTKNMDAYKYKVEDYAASLFLLFEGLFLTKNIPVGVRTTLSHIEKYVDIIVADII